MKGRGAGHMLSLRLLADSDGGCYRKCMALSNIHPSAPMQTYVKDMSIPPLIVGHRRPGNPVSKSTSQISGETSDRCGGNNTLRVVGHIFCGSPHRGELACVRKRGAVSVTHPVRIRKWTEQIAYVRPPAALRDPTLPPLQPPVSSRPQNETPMICI
ncbi:hypothetical protein SAMN04488579_1122 [Eubacterium barkeri]|uniref:Uncharacterized protein n=1 Tax=Eubacterium barkeri TaxID=1528 RepID=Q0QLE0_EUBBA|nr:unknown [Eubacterium barkeri]SDX95469.1 hypothetical protein SAMN04488579_1122 [Eubacterium barkeri]